jgi:integrase/recombinase XerD
MLNTYSDRIFDTLVDTKKIYVAMKENFNLREYVNSEGKSPVILVITGNRERERIPLEIYVDPKQWDSKKQMLLAKSPEDKDTNLILETVRSKLTTIKASYRLAERPLTPKLLRKEFLNGMPRVKFVAFIKMALPNEKPFMKPGSYKRLEVVHEKIKKFDPEASFMDIDHNWLLKYKKYYLKEGNVMTTISGNIATIKKFLGIAVKAGIKLKINLEDIKVGSTKGNRTSLSPHELKLLAEYYFSNHINESYRLVLGYFLFSCMTGLRISDVQKLTRDSLTDGYITFVATKTEKDQSIALNENAKRIIKHDQSLFMKKFADQHINDELKKICRSVGIQKKVTFHVARHTFATSFLRAGGKVEKLQMLLGHSTLAQTMIYVHIVQDDANSEIFLLDKLF